MSLTEDYTKPTYDKSNRGASGLCWEILMLRGTDTERLAGCFLKRMRLGFDYILDFGLLLALTILVSSVTFTIW